MRRKASLFCFPPRKHNMASCVCSRTYLGGGSRPLGRRGCMGRGSQETLSRDHLSAYSPHIFELRYGLRRSPGIDKAQLLIYIRIAIMRYEALGNQFLNRWPQVRLLPGPPAFAGSRIESSAYPSAYFSQTLERVRPGRIDAGPLLIWRGFLKPSDLFQRLPHLI